MFYKHPANPAAYAFVKHVNSLRAVLMKDIQFHAEVAETVGGLDDPNIKRILMQNLTALERIRTYFNAQIAPAANSAIWVTRRRFWLTSRDHELAELYEYASIGLFSLRDALNYYFDNTMALVRKMSEDNTERVET